MRQVLTFLKVFVAWALLGALSKVFFLGVYHSLITDLSLGDYIAVTGHGLRLDLAIAGYFSALPALILIASVWCRHKAVRLVWRVWFAVASLLAAVVFVANIALYGYWGFPLDDTPLLYLRTSPADALASVSTWQLLGFFALILVLACCFYLLFDRIGKSVFAAKRNGGEPVSVSQISVKKKCAYTGLMLLLTAALIIPIRGGFATGVNHTGSVYYSPDLRLNHAAVNPLFSLFESMAHHEEIGSRYRFMADDEAQRLFSTMSCTALRPDAAKHDYNVILICLESFSKAVMGEGGRVKGVVPNLESYTREGLYFTNFYANSFRTDRALVSVLGGLPAQPTLSVMDQPRISNTLPSLASSLRKQGYDTHFYYGGDADFSNMRSYIMGSGYNQVTDQYRFASKYVTGKWGVADGPLYDRVLEELKAETVPATVSNANGSSNNPGEDADESTTKRKPFFKAILSGSSHEPFEVPDYQQLDDPILNAFSYADHCLGRFIDQLRQLPCWDNTLVVIVPDHLGAYPRQLDNMQEWRYQIPLVMLGGAVKQPRQVVTYGSQMDICATVLGMLGIDHSEFRYSKDLLDPDAPHFAFFSTPDAMGMATEGNFVYYDNIAGSPAVMQGTDADSLILRSKAYLQELYTDLGQRNGDKTDSDR